ncbi:uncharacterized protein LOC124348357 [Daphnia pulicaria]|uniref:uncharacterized protein LOC124348357 n=1 Tax=Daphnia pulicaria TaxID=35523 RepID=UPI001EEBEA96|nr:uncharacterized protein LOC124348357 [Daphnia pulicaria]
MELNPPPWNTVDIIVHSQGVIDVLLDKHDFSMSFFDGKEKITVDQMPVFSPIPYDVKKRLIWIKFSAIRMPIDLYYISRSPPCRAVMMTAYLAGFGPQSEAAEPDEPRIHDNQPAAQRPYHRRRRIFF